MDDIDFTNAALLKLGFQRIRSFDDGTTEADVARSIYPVTRDALLAAYPWAFAFAQAAMSSPPFILPADCLRVRNVFGSGLSGVIPYTIRGREVVADASALRVEYTCSVPEARFPKHFIHALIARLAAEMCIPLTESGSRAQGLHELAAAETRLARLMDGQWREGVA